MLGQVFVGLVLAFIILGLTRHQLKNYERPADEDPATRWPDDQDY